MIQDRTLAKAVSDLRQRSERQEDSQKIMGSFVDLGILPQLLNANHQILYGRRGTGKTHIFRVLGSHWSAEPSNTVVYIDARTFGSTSQFSDFDVPIHTRCLSLFKDFLSEIHNALLSHIVYEPSDNAADALSALDQLAQAMTTPVRRQQSEQVSNRLLGKTSDEDGLDLSIGSEDGVKFGITNKSVGATERENTTSFTISIEDKVLFPAINTLLRDVLTKARTKLYILLDEWSSLPLDVQPYLAEFLKRSFLPEPNVILKIASLEYRSAFNTRRDSRDIGFEVGSDISTALDIDDHYVYDRNPERVIRAFAEILYNHLKSELPVDYLEEQYEVQNAQEFISSLFAGKAVFKELVRASEGVVRDLMNMFSVAFFSASLQGKEVVEQKDIMRAARQWFEQDKGKNLDPDMIRALERIIKKVIGHYRVRSFMISRELEKHPVIQRLFDLRILHLASRGIIDPSNPGRRYNIYSLDYATYIDLINASESGFKRITGGVPDGFVVPFGDKRAIRKVVLTENILAP